MFFTAVFMCSWGPIPIAFRCDGHDNCGDNADEENCEKSSESSDRGMCVNSSS